MRYDIVALQHRISYIDDRPRFSGGDSILKWAQILVNRGHIPLWEARGRPFFGIGCMNFRATRPVTVKCLAAVTSCIILLLSLTYSPIEVDITDTQLGMGEQVSFTRFLCCACHARSEGSAFFGTRRAAELHISRSAGCKNACKGVQSHQQTCQSVCACMWIWNQYVYVMVLHIHTHTGFLYCVCMFICVCIVCMCMYLKYTIF